MKMLKFTKGFSQHEKESYDITTFLTMCKDPLSFELL